MDHTPDAEAGEPTRKPLPQSREEMAVRVIKWADPGRIWKEELIESPDGLHAGHKRQRDVRVVPGHSVSWRKTLRKIWVWGGENGRRSASDMSCSRCLVAFQMEMPGKQ